MTKDTIRMLKKVFSNPFYCINISPALIWEHELLASEEEWIKVWVRSIEEDWAEEYLRNLLENLKGNFE